MELLSCVFVALLVAERAIPFAVKLKERAEESPLGRLVPKKSAAHKLPLENFVISTGSLEVAGGALGEGGTIAVAGLALIAVTRCVTAATV